MSEIKKLRKAAFKVVRLSERVSNYSAAKVDDAIQDLGRMLRGKEPYKTFSKREAK